MATRKMPFELGIKHPVTLGDSFKQGTRETLHTIRYDFKPQSLAGDQRGELVVDANDKVFVRLPQAGSDEMLQYQGSKKSTNKECVLLFDPQTNTFRLEQLRSAITVKQIRTKGGPSRDLPPSQLPIIAQASRSGSKASKTTRKVQEGSRLPIEATALQPPTEDAPEPEPGPCIIAPVLRLEPEPPAKIPCTEENWAMELEVSSSEEED